MNNPKLRFKREDSTDYPEWKKTKIGKLTKTFSASRVHREEWQTEGVPFWRSSDVMAFHQHKENAMGKAFITNVRLEFHISFRIMSHCMLKMATYFASRNQIAITQSSYISFSGRRPSVII